MKSRFSMKQPTPDPELETLKEELHSARNDLQTAYSQFNLAVEPELIESCIYQIKAIQARCNYLLRAIKSRSHPAVPAVSQNREDGVTWI